MTKAFVADLLKENPTPNVFDRAILTLRFIGRHGFSEEVQTRNGKKVCALQVEQDDTLPARLVQAAAIITDPDIQTYFDEKKSVLALEFPDSAEKPPVRLMWSSLEKIKSYFFDQCIEVAPNGSGYIINNPGKLPIDPVAFAASFIADNEVCTPYYQLPKGTLFVDKAGLRHSDKTLADDTVMEEYLTKFAPGTRLDQCRPIKLQITPETMTRIIQEFGLMPTKGAYFS
jgi:hypothetical protein